MLQHFLQEGQLTHPLIYGWDVDDENETTWGDPMYRLHTRVERGGRVKERA